MAPDPRCAGDWSITGYRLFRPSLIGEVLTYRSPLRTRTWRRDQIAEFGIVQSAWRVWVGYLFMRALDGEQVIFHVASGSRRRLERLQIRLAVLRGWLSDAGLR